MLVQGEHLKQFLNISFAEKVIPQLFRLVHEKIPKQVNVETSPVKLKERKKCRKCAKVFTSIPLLNKHMLNHHDEICKVCERKFQSSDLLKEHIKVHEEQSSIDELLSTEKKLEISVTPQVIINCELCDSSFDTLEILGQHMESEHSEV